MLWHDFDNRRSSRSKLRSSCLHVLVSHSLSVFCIFQLALFHSPYCTHNIDSCILLPAILRATFGCIFDMKITGAPLIMTSGSIVGSSTRYYPSLLSCVRSTATHLDSLHSKTRLSFVVFIYHNTRKAAFYCSSCGNSRY